MNPQKQQDLADWQQPRPATQPADWGRPAPTQTQPDTQPRNTTIQNQESKIENRLHVRLIPLDQIVPNPHQPRRQFDEAALQELADSIKLHGVLQPVLLRQRANDRYEIIAGERRVRAAELAGLTAIPALVREFDDRNQAEFALIENLQREDLNPVETARALRALMQQFHITQTELGQRIGKSKSVISRLLHLLQLPEEILGSLERNEIQEKHARLLLNIQSDVVLAYVWQQITTRRLSVRETERVIRAAQNTQPELLQNALETPLPLEPETDAPYRDSTLGDSPNDKRLMTELSEKYYTRILVRRYGTEGGHLEMHFITERHLHELGKALLKQVA